ncbi:MAG: ABC transporter permease, partial [Gemmatimonadales bacterium]
MTSWLRAALRRTARDGSGRRGLLLLAGIALIALLGPLVLPDPAAQPDLLRGALLPPGLHHPFGTDQLSRDVLSRV